jgi:NAD(P)H-hydrate epimerase
MLKVSTAKEMQDIDRISINKYRIAGTVLMERAGLSVVNKINEIYYGNTEHPEKLLNRAGRAQNIDGKKVIILCGGGNNGGDGLVIARELHNQGRDVDVYLSVKPLELKGDAKANYTAAKKFGVNIFPVKHFMSGYRSLVKRQCLIVDALLGTGLSQDVRPLLSNVIRKVNKLSCSVIAVDIPSGISSDSGRIMGCAVKARHTVTFGLPKRGHFLYPGADFTGQLFIEDIGFPAVLLESEKIKIHLVQHSDAVSLLPERPAYSHKGTFGHVLLVAGSRGKTGAALMAAKACLKSGAGLVTIGVPESLVHTFQSRVTEEMILPLPDNGSGTVSCEAADPILSFSGKKASVLAIGPGLSLNKDISLLVCKLIAESNIPVILDADGINAVSGKERILKKSRVPVILTPHPGEMAGLLRQNTEYRTPGADRIRKDIENNRIETALTFAKKTNTCLVLKGVPTVTASPEGQVFINSSGNQGMATAGTGDVLTGLIASFMAQKMLPQDAAVAGVYMHGLFGDAAAARKGTRSLVASDMINIMPAVLRNISVR